jgi:hypothetical protein
LILFFIFSFICQLLQIEKSEKKFSLWGKGEEKEKQGKG